VAHILGSLTESASLPEIVECLCRWRDGDLLEREARPVAVPTYPEVCQLLAATESQRDALIFRTLYASGIRVGEAVKLIPGDLHPRSDMIFVRAGKGDIDRYALVDSQTMRLLAAWSEGRASSARLFPVSAPHVWKLVQQWGKRTGLVQKYAALGLRLSPHSFRHAFATHCYSNGMPVEVVQALLGHAFLRNTEIYIHGGLAVWQGWYTKTHELARKGGSNCGISEA